ncbi:MAG: tetratricopeptide (TPR) repeat protein [Planctomycetota bacterium]
MQAAEIDSILQSIQEKIVARQFDDALVDLSELRQLEPENTEALYMVAVCHRYRGEFNKAIEYLNQLKDLVPEHGRAHQEEGHIYRDMGRSDQALQAYNRACRMNPALLSSWRAQLEILTREGLQQQASQIRVQLERLENLPKTILAVTDLIAQGRLLKAEDICRQFLLKVPQHVEAMRLLADIGVRLGVLDDAEFLLESAVEFEPENVQVRIDYVQTLRKRQKFHQALEQAKVLLDRAPDNPQFLSLYAVECMQTGEFDKAIDLFNKVLEQLPGDPITLTSLGYALKTSGRYQDAVNSFQSALESNLQHGEAWYALANLKVYVFTDDEISKMRSLEDNPNLSHLDRIYLYFALGKAYEDRDDYPKSFSCYESGNRLKKVQCRYKAEQMSEDLNAQHIVCTPELFEEKQGLGCPAPDPIFIVGMPRAGSTLLEQIISSHSQVDGTLELPNILSLSHRLRRGEGQNGDKRYPTILRELDAEQLRQFGEQFINDTQIHRQGAPFFIDKMPNNFRHIGLIKLILPNAKIIDARRNPMSCCFSNFKQLFAEGQEFTYGLDEVGRYYSDYVSLMNHWGEVLPGFVLSVQYEEVVGDLETQVRRILEFLKLPFEKQCLEYHETERAVRTPSSEQVRQPIYRDGLKEWKNFEPWLDSLKTSLKPVLL